MPAAYGKQSREIAESAAIVDGQRAMAGISDMIDDVEASALNVDEEKILELKEEREFDNLDFRQILQQVVQTWKSVSRAFIKIIQDEPLEEDDRTRNLLKATFSPEEMDALRSVLRNCVKSFQKLPAEEKVLLHSMLFRFKAPHDYLMEMVRQERPVANSAHQMLKTYRQMFNAGQIISRYHASPESKKQIINGLFYLSKYILCISPSPQIPEGILSRTYVRQQLPTLVTLLKKQTELAHEATTRALLIKLQQNPEALLRDIPTKSGNVDDVIALQVQRLVLPKFAAEIISHPQSNYIYDLQSQEQTQRSRLLLKTFLFYLLRSIPAALLELFRQRREYFVKYLVEFVDLPKGGVAIAYDLIDVRQLDPTTADPELQLDGKLIHYLCSDYKRPAKEQLSLFLQQLDVGEIEQLLYNVVHNIEELNVEPAEIKRLKQILGKRRRTLADKPQVDYAQNRKLLGNITKIYIPPITAVFKGLIKTLARRDEVLSAFGKLPAKPKNTDLGTSVLVKKAEPVAPMEPAPRNYDAAPFPNDLTFATSDVLSFRKWNTAEPGDSFVESIAFMQPVARVGTGQSFAHVEQLKDLITLFAESAHFNGEKAVHSFAGKQGPVSVEKVYALFTNPALRAHALTLCLGLGYHRNAPPSFYQAYADRKAPEQRVNTFPYLLLFCQKEELLAGVNVDHRAVERRLHFADGTTETGVAISLGTQRELMFPVVDTLEGLTRAFLEEKPELKPLIDFCADKRDFLRKGIEKAKGK
jgi:hypothetical protein